MGTKEDHWEFNILKGGHSGQKIECLENESNMAQSESWEEGVRGVFVNSISHDEQLSTWRGVNGANKIEHGGLSSTRWSSDHDEFTPIELSSS